MKNAAIVSFPDFLLSLHPFSTRKKEKYEGNKEKSRKIERKEGGNNPGN